MNLYIFKFSLIGGIPLLIYGADFKIDEDITIEKLVENVDDISWKEFMPPDVTKEIFSKFKILGKIGFSIRFTEIANNIREADLGLKKYTKILEKID